MPCLTLMHFPGTIPCWTFRLQGRLEPGASSPSNGQGRASPSQPVRCGRPALAFRSPPFCDFHVHEHRRLQQEQAALQDGAKAAPQQLLALQEGAREQRLMHSKGAPMALPLPGGEDECDSDESRRNSGDASKGFALQNGERENRLGEPLEQPPLGVPPSPWQVGPWDPRAGAGGQGAGAMCGQGLQDALPWQAPEGAFAFAGDWQEGGGEPSRHGSARSAAGAGEGGGSPWSVAAGGSAGAVGGGAFAGDAGAADSPWSATVGAIAGAAGAGTAAGDAGDGGMLLPPLSLLKGGMRAQQGSPVQLLPEGLGSAESGRESAWPGQPQVAGAGSGVGGMGTSVGGSKAGPLAQEEAPTYRPISGLPELSLSAVGGKARVGGGSAAGATTLYQALPGAASFLDGGAQTASTSGACHLTLGTADLLEPFSLRAE